MKALITGIYGFVGYHLAHHLLDNGHRVAGFALESDIDPKALPGEIKTYVGDLREPKKINEALADFAPDWVFHLAALSSVKLSFENPAETFSINIMGSLNLLETISQMKSPAKIILVSSSEIYGQLKPEDVPVKETALLMPVNPYGVSKAAVDMLGYQYFKAYGLPVFRIRAFSHSGPRQGTQAVLSDWALQAARIELGLATPEIKVGNMEVTRDYTDVRDIVRAYVEIIEKAKPGEAYNACSGKGYHLNDLLSTIVSFCPKKIKIAKDPSRYRPVDIPVLIGSPDKLKKDTGWEPAIDIKNTLKDLYNYWLNHLAPKAI
jgi:GDP-4-dehydro-6-deoxy-D-mannose reductase